MRKWWRFEWTEFNGTRSVVWLSGAKSYKEAVAEAQSMGWTPPRWWQWWRWDDTPRARDAARTPEARDA